MMRTDAPMSEGEEETYVEETCLPDSALQAKNMHLIRDWLAQHYRRDDMVVEVVDLMSECVFPRPIPQLFSTPSFPLCSRHSSSMQHMRVQNPGIRFSCVRPWTSGEGLTSLTRRRWWGLVCRFTSIDVKELEAVVDQLVQDGVLKETSVEEHFTVCRTGTAAAASPPPPRPEAKTKAPVPSPHTAIARPASPRPLPSEAARLKVLKRVLNAVPKVKDGKVGVSTLAAVVHKSIASVDEMVQILLENGMWEQTTLSQLNRRITALVKHGTHVHCLRARE